MQRLEELRGGYLLHARPPDVKCGEFCRAIEGNHGFLSDTCAEGPPWLPLVLSIWEAAQERHATLTHDRIYGIYALMKAFDLKLSPPHYEKSLDEIYGELTVSLLTACRSLAPLYSFWNPDRVHANPCWMSFWKASEKPYLLNHGGGYDLDKGHKALFRDTFVLKAVGGFLEVEGVLKPHLQDWSTQFPAKPQEDQTGSEVERYAALASTMLDWFKSSIQTALPEHDCPDGTPAWKAFCNALIRLEKQCRTVCTNCRCKFHLAIEASTEEESTIAIRAVPMRRLQRNKTHSLQDNRSVYVVPGMNDGELRDVLVKIAKSYPNGRPFRTIDGWVGIAINGFDDEDVLALLHGLRLAAILRPYGQQYRIRGFASIEGVPDSAWPLEATSPGVQRILLC